MFRFALKRKTGYMSTYSLGMIWVAWRKGVFHQGREGRWVSPMYFSFCNSPWIRAWPAVVRPISFIVRKIEGTDAHGQYPKVSYSSRPYPWRKN